MTDSDRMMLNRIQNYAEEVMPDIDPEKVKISEQIDKLRPVLQQIAMEQSMPVEDVFIKYMDLATERALEYEQKMKDDFGDIMSTV
ncbi:MAG: hypothetical protein K5868_03875 [Lachnospiraceae bacterium]|nr:hypothetical protein [Lachnospiraceae bacterium]